MLRYLRRALDRELRQEVDVVADGGVAPQVPFASELLEEGREELARADGKASILLGASSVVLGVLFTSIADGSWSPSDLDQHNLSEGIFCTGVGSALLGVILLTLAVLPRTRHQGDREELAYFGHVVHFRESGVALRKSTRKRNHAAAKKKLARAMVRASLRSFDRTVDQVWIISNIVHRKYKLIYWGLVSYGFAVVLCGAALVLDNHF